MVKPDAVLKGTDRGPVKVLTRIGGADEAKWRMMLPFELEVGTSWYLFLKKSGDAYTPTAGLRSAFLVEGDKLFENLQVPSKFRPRDLESEVRAVAHD
jgi:hypothetical protein